jgi:hypothetical protein
MQNIFVEWNGEHLEIDVAIYWKSWNGYDAKILRGNSVLVDDQVTNLRFHSANS